MKPTQVRFSNVAHFFNFRELRRFRAYFFTKTRTYKLQDASVYSIFRNGDAFTAEKHRLFNHYKKRERAKDINLTEMKLQIFSIKSSKKIFRITSFKVFQNCLRTNSLCRRLCYKTKAEQLSKYKLNASKKILTNEVDKINEITKTIEKKYERMPTLITYENFSEKQRMVYSSWKNHLGKAIKFNVNTQAFAHCYNVIFRLKLLNANIKYKARQILAE